MEEIFSQRLREYLWREKITQTELTERTGLTGAAISHYVNGKQCPHAWALLRIAEALDISIDYLLGRTDREKVVR